MNSLPPPSYSDSYKTRLLSSKMFQKTWYIFLKSSWKIQAYSFSVHAFSMFKNAGSLPESMQMWVDHVAWSCWCLWSMVTLGDNVWVHADVLMSMGSRSCCSWAWCWCLWPVPLPEGSAGTCGLCCCLKSCWCPWAVLPPDAILMSVVCAATGDPCLDLQSVLLHESLLESVAHAATRGHVEVCGPCWHGRTGRYQVSVLLPDTMWSQWPVLLLCWLFRTRKLLLQWKWWLQTCSWEWHRRLLWQPPPSSHLTKKKQPILEVLKRTL